MSTRIQSNEILETVKMVADQNFDVRTITIGIDLHDCISPDIEVLNQNIYNKITRVGKDLVQTAKHLSAKYGVPIVNQRISVTPIAQIAAATGADSYVSIAQTLDKAAKAIGVSFIGGFSALVQKGMSPADEVLIRSIPEAMQTTEIVCSSINIGSTRAGNKDGTQRVWAERRQALVDIGFLDPAAPKKLMPRLQQLFNRAQPTAEEIHILRGIAKAMQGAAAAHATCADTAPAVHKR